MISRLFHQYYQHHENVITRFLLLAGLAAVAGAIAGQARAESGCMPSEAAFSAAERSYGEMRMYDATVDLPGGAADIAITLKPKTGSWSLWTLGPVGVACMAASGQKWRAADVELRPEPLKPQRYLRQDDEGRLRYFIP